MRVNRRSCGILSINILMMESNNRAKGRLLSVAEHCVTFAQSLTEKAATEDKQHPLQQSINKLHLAYANNLIEVAKEITKAIKDIE